MRMISLKTSDKSPFCMFGFLNGQDNKLFSHIGFLKDSLKTESTKGKAVAITTLDGILFSDHHLPTSIFHGLGDMRHVCVGGTHCSTYQAYFNCT